MDIIALIKWGAGYPTDEFNMTYRALRDYAAADVDICCITDNPQGLDPGLKTIALPDIPMDPARWADGMWPKLAMFKHDIFPAGARVIFMDVDVAVVAPVAELFDVISDDTIHIIKDWPTYHEKWFPKLFRVVRGGNSSVVGFVAGRHTELWDRFNTDTQTSLATYRNDQDYITGEARDLRYFPEHWIGSFKKSVAPLPPIAWFSACRPHPDCKIVAFHGKPDISDLSARHKSYIARLLEGFGHVQWVEDYLDKYAPQKN